MWPLDLANLSGLGTKSLCVIHSVAGESASDILMENDVLYGIFHVIQIVIQSEDLVEVVPCLKHHRHSDSLAF